MTRKDEAERSDSPHLMWADDWRGLAALYVVLHHASQNVQRGWPSDWLAQTLHEIFAWGHCAVDVFIVLSGFCLAMPLVRQAQFGSVGGFMLRRAARVVLPYYAACALSLVLIALVIGERSGTHWDASLPVTAWGVLTHALLIHPWWAQTRAQIDHPLWSVGVEYQIYLVLPLLLYAFRRIGVWHTLAWIVPLPFIAWRLTAHSQFPDPSPWGASIYYVALFAMGAAAAHLAPGAPSQRPPARVDLVALVGFSVLMMVVLLHEVLETHEVSLQVLSYFVGVFTAAAIIVRLGRTATVRLRRLHGVLQWLGSRSFSLYLVHAPVLQLAWIFIVRPLHPATLGAQMAWTLCVGSTLSLACSEAFYRIVERPCHQLSRRLPSAAKQGWG